MSLKKAVAAAGAGYVNCNYLFEKGDCMKSAGIYAGASIAGDMAVGYLPMKGLLPRTVTSAAIAAIGHKYLSEEYDGFMKQFLEGVAIHLQAEAINMGTPSMGGGISLPGIGSGNTSILYS